MKGINLKDFEKYIKEESIKEGIQILTVYKFLQIVKNYFKKNSEN